MNLCRMGYRSSEEQALKAGEDVLESCLTRGNLYAPGSQRMSRRRQGMGVTNEGSPSAPQQHLPWLRLLSKVTLTLILSRSGAISHPLALGGLW